jgi:anti-anti-sigma factor
VTEPSKVRSTVEFAQLPDKVAVLRVVGRCTFQNSAYLEKASDICDKQGDCAFVLDLERCESMDSTFLGVLAGIAMRQKRQGRGNLIAVNASPSLQRTMSLLGLTHVLDLRERRIEGKPDREIEVGEGDQVRMSRADQVAHMIEAHQRLIEVDSGNEVRFDNVLQYLGESLKRARAAERKRPPNNDS